MAAIRIYPRGDPTPISNFNLLDTICKFGAWVFLGFFTFAFFAFILVSHFQGPRQRNVFVGFDPSGEANPLLGDAPLSYGELNYDQTEGDETLLGDGPLALGKRSRDSRRSRTLTYDENGPRVGNLEGVEYDASDEADSSSGNVPLKDAEISRNPEVGSILGDVPLRDEEISCDREVDSHLGEESCDPKRPEALTSNEDAIRTEDLDPTAGLGAALSNIEASSSATVHSLFM